jgi:hypothetical protein
MIKHILDVVCHHIHGIMLCPSANTQFILTYLLQGNVPDTYVECVPSEKDFFLQQLLQTAH